MHHSASENIYPHLSALQSTQGMFSASVSKSSFRLHSTDRLHSNRPEGDWLSGVAGWCGWLGSGQRKQLVAHEKTISGQRQSPGGRTCDAQRLKVRCPAAEGATSAGGEEERQERRDGARNYRKTPLEATCRQADSEVRYTRCSYHQCASQHIRKHLSENIYTHLSALRII